MFTFRWISIANSSRFGCSGHCEIENTIFLGIFSWSQANKFVQCRCTTTLDVIECQYEKVLDTRLSNQPNFFMTLDFCICCCCSCCRFDILTTLFCIVFLSDTDLMVSCVAKKYWNAVHTWLYGWCALPISFPFSRKHDNIYKIVQKSEICFGFTAITHSWTLQLWKHDHRICRFSNSLNHFLKFINNENDLGVSRLAIDFFLNELNDT